MTQSMSANMQTAATGVGEIDRSIKQIAEAARQVGDATGKVRMAAQQVA